MDRNTPLEQVATHMPDELALTLLQRPPHIRAGAVAILRDAIVCMEEQGGQLDPVAYRAVVYSMGIMAIMAAEYGDVIHQMGQVLERVRAQD